MFSTIEVLGTGMAGGIIDQAMQASGIMGMRKEPPLQQLANVIRVVRIYEGPSGVQRMALARQVLKDVSQEAPRCFLVNSALWADAGGVDCIPV